MKREGMNRRRFLESSGQAAAGVMVLASSGATLMIAADGAWAMALKTLDGHGGQVLLSAVRTMYPHDALSDRYYAQVVEGLDQEASLDPAIAELLKTGVADLDRAMPVPWLDLSEGNREQALRSIETTTFFQKLRGKTITTLYNDERVWQAFGYEGPSFDDGGYLERGFDDLAWLPDPPEEASPPMEL
jgi:hypothetical protein